jgi:hypothetical protein
VRVVGTEGDAAVRAATITFRPIDRYSLNKKLFDNSYRFTHITCNARTVLS